MFVIAWKDSHDWRRVDSATGPFETEEEAEDHALHVNYDAYRESRWYSGYFANVKGGCTSEELRQWQESEDGKKWGDGHILDIEEWCDRMDDLRYEYYVLPLELVEVPASV